MTKVRNPGDCEKSDLGSIVNFENLFQRHDEPDRRLALHHRLVWILFWHGKKRCYSAQAFLKKAKKKSRLKLLTWLSLTNLNNLNNTNKTKYNDNKQIDKKKIMKLDYQTTQY
jgi:hypothetical protein